MKKILIIQGGGRPKGNTRQLVDAFAQGAMEAGHEEGMLLAGGCGDTNGKTQIDKTNHLAEAYEFGKLIYA